MNSIQDTSSTFQMNISEEFDSIKRNNTQTKPVSQFLNYKKTTKYMKEHMENSLSSDSDIIILVCDSSSDEKQSESESENSLSYLKRFNESWIRII